MKLFGQKNKTAPAKPRLCPGLARRLCPMCLYPVTNPYALTCPRCRSELPAMPDCGACRQCKDF